MVDRLVAVDDADYRLPEPVIATTIEAVENGVGVLRGERGVTRTIYVRADGDDVTGDGLTELTAFREIKTAVASLSEHGPMTRGTISINVGAGVYKGGILLPITRGSAQDDFIRIIGPSVGGHPNVPTAIIDYDADTSVSYGIQANNGRTLWLQDLKFIGGFAVAVDIRKYSSLLENNVHIDGEGVGLVGFGFLTQCFYDARGGIVENCVDVGVQEHFGVTRSFDTVTSTAGAMIIRNNGVGLRAKEDCHGHVDYVSFLDNDIGLEMHAWTTANVKAATFKNNGTGILVVNSEVHNEGGVIWGTGAESNGRRFVSLGNSDELLSWGWPFADPNVIQAGHRPLKQVANTYVDSTWTGTGAQVAYQSPTILPAGRLSVAGRHVKVVTWWSVVTPPTTSSTITLLLGGNVCAQVVVPSTAVATQDFKVEFDAVCPVDGNNQKSIAFVNGFPAGLNSYALTTHALSDADFSAAVRVTHAETGTSLILRAAEVWA